MKITAEFLEAEIAKMEQQRNHAHDVATASQAAIDVMRGLLGRLRLPEPVGEEAAMTFAQLGLPDPVPVDNLKEAT